LPLASPAGADEGDLKGPCDVDVKAVSSQFQAERDFPNLCERTSHGLPGGKEPSFSGQIVRFISYALQTLIKGQVGKQFDPLAGISHIREVEPFISRILKPSKSVLKEL
jgi:hypothetical protein